MLFVAFLLSTPYKITHHKKRPKRIKRTKRTKGVLQYLFIYINIVMRGREKKPTKKEKKKWKTKQSKQT